ncbi:hypothetical protein M9Y10_025378 [Tritrichomonas musculus]|uniref:Uncharacterized protein n=1 Tax=Tritrichomonas musculus TaxID=1915356 RepID=A0ABR2HAB1_9EUKA
MNNNFFDNYQNEIIQNIIPFLALNSQILAYQQLLVDMLEFYNYKEDELIVYLIIQNILQVSFKSVKYIQEFYRETEKVFDDNDRLTHYQERNQPLNIKNNSIPIWPLTLNEIENGLLKKDINKQIKWKYDNKKYQGKIKFQTVEDAEMQGYLLLMSLRNSLKDNDENLLKIFIKDEENNYPLIHALLYCGTHCNSKSLISLEAFKSL